MARPDPFPNSEVKRETADDTPVHTGGKVGSAGFYYGKILVNHKTFFKDIKTSFYNKLLLVVFIHAAIPWSELLGALKKVLFV